MRFFFLLLINYFGNVMMKLIANNRTYALKTDVKLLFIKTNCQIKPLSLLDVSHKLQFHVSLRLLTMKISQ